jgi:hypothetical protein
MSDWNWLSTWKYWSVCFIQTIKLPVSVGQRSSDCTEKESEELLTFVSSTTIRGPWTGQSPSHSWLQSSQTAIQHSHHHHKLKVKTPNSSKGKMCWESESVKIRRKLI